MYMKRLFLLQAKVDLFPSSWIIGLILLSAGTILHLWTARLLGLRGIIGIPEISQKVKKGLVTGGPYTVVRHPTYLAHTLLFTGVFLITGVLSVAVLTSVDFLMVNAVIIPVEERELQSRFGDEYRRYREKVPFCFVPWIF
jgi:protein-S-isoprenylcysteine O-methyltransferase Ste14